ncbi:upper zone of growth plate and cartilage matrix associated a [Genypterus blacodes]|uniref:upper zone of growth plate and cartilage matrix associated a n=1 Tax=Genypterus blacodes TaxID=154954 RepID=UPI003F777974
MCWTRLFVLSLLTALIVLTIPSVVDSAAIIDDTLLADNPKEQEAFVPEPDVAHFSRNRGRRSIDYYRELLAEQRRREGSGDRNYDQQRRDYEHYLEEERSERNERMRQYQWRALHAYGGHGYGYGYGGYYPHSYYYHHY